VVFAGNKGQRTAKPPARSQPESSWSRNDHEDGGPTIQLPAAESRCTLRLPTPISIRVHPSAAEFGPLPGGSRPIAATLASDGTITARVSRVRVERARQLALVRSGTVMLPANALVGLAVTGHAYGKLARHGTSASVNIQ
jgi:hypothetical protein